MQILLRSLPIALLIAVAAGCSDDAGAPGNPPGTCGFSPSGKAGAVTVTPGASVSHAKASITAQNTPELDEKGHLAGPAFGTLRRGSCGDVGLVIKKANGTDTELLYVDAKTAKTEIVEAKAKSIRNTSLFFDAACSPIVVHGTSSKYEQYTRDKGTWSKSVILGDTATVLPAKPTSFQHVASTIGADSKLYVFAKAKVNDKSMLVRGVRDATAAAKWSFEALPGPAATEIYSYRVDAKGNTVLLYRNTKYPCDPCNVDLKLGTLAAKATSWTEVIVQVGHWGAPADAFVESGSLAFDKAGDPIVAAHFVRRGLTGSYKSTELRIYGQKADKWCGETVATTDDSFAGTDGNKFTGSRPKLFIDDADRLHLIFNDLSVWHANSNENAMRGQLRYAIRAGDKWTITTVVKQKGQVASKSPLHGFGNATFAVSPDGKEAIVGGLMQSWETDSIYNSDSKPATVETVSIPLMIAAP